MKHAGVIGGSVAGCAAAQALRRAGFTVTVFERSTGDLRGRGAGIAIPRPLYEALAAGRDLPCVPVSRRRWVVRDDAGGTRLLWDQPSPAAAVGWPALWRGLRDTVPDHSYRTGARCAGIDEDAGSVTARFEDGTRHRFDLLIGADGHDSQVRRLLHPEPGVHIAGYRAWRGTCPLAGVPEVTGLLDDAWVTACHPHGHAVYYPIPGEPGTAGTLVNWVAYSFVPTAPAAPPGAVPRALWEDFLAASAPRLPRDLYQVLARTDREKVSVQTVGDATVPAYGRGRIALAGDAGALSRPHASSGVLKAHQDAQALEAAFTREASVPDALKHYDTARTAAANAVVALGARLGLHQVEQTPDWPSMAPADFDDWTRALLAGHSHYLYANAAARAATERDPR
ncbi:FAD-dependent monooxygenase [Streptomyces niveiscabiei]|uniref:FAD-dependent monooxygenase n=1 Tax=Streptomyces niveiscabiei TaxID=164115 RepID=A0ABW9HGE2_9ACTN